MAKKLTNLKITKVSLVDEGACSAAHITLFKRKEGGNEGMNYDEVLSSLTEEQQAIIKAKHDELQKSVEESEAEVQSAKENTKQLEEEKQQLQQEKEELEKSTEEEKQKLEDEVCKLKEELQHLQESTDNTEEDILKNVDPAVREMLQKAKQEADVHRQAVLKMKEEQETSELTQIAKSMTGVGTEENQLVSILRKAKSADLELYNDVKKALEVANNIIADSMVMKSIGSTVDQVDGDAWAKVDAKAEEIAKERNITKQKATGVVMSEFPELYQAYLNELK